MKTLNFLWVAASIIVLVGSCNPDPVNVDYQPTADFFVLPESGNTTTIFRFDASKSLLDGLEDNPVFVRWDWNNDGTWDKMYSSGGEMTHRFFQKGDYTVVMEAATLLGKKDTATISLSIKQGYSPPRAHFTIFPDSANLLNEFIFDGSGSKDDEDSLDQLQFRWDFNGDNIWETEFLTEPITSFLFDDDQYYESKLEVRDPQGMTGITSKQVIVTRFNDEIIPVILSECWPCTVEDSIRFDASESYITGDPDATLRYSWDIQNDNIWELEMSSSPFFSYLIPFEGIHEIKLRVIDSQGLYMDTIQVLEIFPVNSPPVTVLTLGNRYGNPSTHFYLHARWSTDREDGYFDRHIEWDLNDDGIWDEEYDNLYEVWTNFDEPGFYPIALQVTDTKGKFSIDYDTIQVQEGIRPTDILEDKRGSFVPQYYPTVLIGDTWWMQENVRYVPQSPPAGYSVKVYMDEMDKVKTYGYLYPYAAIVDRYSPCPDGWRIPSVADWEQLMEDLGQEVKISDLLIGGSSELNLLLTGHHEHYGYIGRGRFVNYYTTNTTPTGQSHLWYIDTKLNKNMSLIAGRIYWLPVRCIK